MHVFTWSLATVTAGTALLVAQSGLSNFGLVINQLKPQIVGALRSGYIPVYPNRKLYKAASTPARVAFVKEALNWLKSYTESVAFKADYDKQRVEAKPEAPQSKGTPDEQYAKQQAEQRKGIEDMKKNVAKMTPEMQQQMKEVVKQMEAALEQNSKNPQVAEMMKSNYAREAQSDEEGYKKDLANYEANFPADPKVMIAKRLNEFLEETKGIDYNAQLVSSGGGMMRFADQQYESKTDRWKLCYRAGREPTEAARAFAADWLRQLGAK